MLRRPQAPSSQPSNFRAKNPNHPSPAQAGGGNGPRPFRRNLKPPGVDTITADGYNQPIHGPSRPNTTSPKSYQDNKPSRVLPNAHNAQRQPRAPAPSSNLYSSQKRGLLSRHQPARGGGGMRGDFSVLGDMADQSHHRRDGGGSDKRRSSRGRERDAYGDYDRTITAQALMEEKRYAASRKDKSSERDKPDEKPFQMPKPKSDEDVRCKRLRLEDIETPLTMSLFGGSGQGKTNAICTFFAQWQFRFSIIYVFSPTPLTRLVMRNWTLDNFIYDKFEPVVMEKIICLCEAAYAANNGTKLDVCFFLDDLLTNDPKAKNHPIFVDLYKRCHHVGITVVETKHAVTDTVKENRESIHMIGVMGKAKALMLESMYKTYFREYAYDLDHFKQTVATATRKEPGSCLFINIREPTCLYFLRTRKYTELAPFCLGHRDLYVLSYLMGCQKAGMAVGKDGKPLHQFQGLHGIAAIKKAFELEDAEGENKEDVDHTKPSESNIVISEREKLYTAKHGAEAAAAKKFHRVIIEDDDEDEAK